jgi:hypothetical protein
VLHHLPTAEGYGGYLHQQRYVRMLHYRDRLAAEGRKDADERWRRLFAVAYVAANVGEPLTGALVFQSAEPSPQPIAVFHDPQTPPRLQLVYDPIWTGSDAAALERVFDPQFDPGKQVVLEESAPPSTATAGQAGMPVPLAQTEGSLEGTASIVADEPERLVCSVEVTQPGFLIIADAYYPAWRATVNDAPAQILRANYVFRAVPVPAGTSTVELRYVNRPVQLGLIVSVVAWFGSIAWLFWRRKGV